METAGSEQRRYFFLHIMKTAGTTFAPQIQANFADEELYPRRQPVRRPEEYWKVAEVRALTPERIAGTRMFHGHFPYFVAGLVGADTTMTLLRDPVERTISHINHCARHHKGNEHRTAESLYDDPWFHPLLFRNYQVKQFALTDEDQPKAHNEVLVIDEDRLAMAVANLDKVTLFGLTDRYAEFLTEVEARFGWTINPGDPLQVAPHRLEVSDALRRRIAEDNQFDIEFYEHARRRYELDHPRP